MPQEDRLIKFDYLELYSAVFSLCSQRGEKRPVSGSIVEVYHPEGDVSRVSIEFYDKKTAKNVVQEYSRDFIAAALMMYCRSSGVPLPKSANKALSIGCDDLTLRVKLGN